MARNSTFVACSICGHLHGDPRKAGKANDRKMPCENKRPDGTACGATNLHWGLVTPAKPGDSMYALFERDGTPHKQNCGGKFVPSGAVAVAENPPATVVTEVPVETRETVHVEGLRELEARVTTVESEVSSMMPMLTGIETAITTELADMRNKLNLAQATRPISFTPAQMPTVDLGRQHWAMTLLLLTLEATKGVGVPFLKGEAGSLKSSAFPEVARAYSLDYETHIFDPSQSSADLVGWVGPNGPVEMPALRCYRDGKLLCLDEIGNASAEALTALNSLLSNGHFNFPGFGMIARHPNFRVMAADNTFGRGGDSLYLRGQLDAATLDRFVYIPWPTDRELVASFRGLTTKFVTAPLFKTDVNPRTVDQYADWADYVFSVADAIADNGGIRAVVGSRALLNGANMLAAGLDRDFVEWAVIWARMSDADGAVIRQRAEEIRNGN